jgi:protein tyrosine phosphatase
MFITQTYKSVNWLKNQTKEGGAMEEVLKTKKEDDIAFNIISKKFGRMWGSCDNTTALKLIEKNSGLNEILHKFPMKVYFDIDKTENLKEDEITTYKNLILKYIPDAKMSISGSETNEKHSYHITLTNYVFNDMIERDDFKIFVKEYLFEEDNGFDTKVYTKN